MQYDNLDVYVDHSTRNKSNSKESKDSKKNGKISSSDDGPQDEFL
jgi:hypothetical protein